MYAGKCFYARGRQTPASYAFGGRIGNCAKMHNVGSRKGGS